MRIKDHWEKAARLEASRAKGLNGRDDYELIIWSCIQGGAQLASVILHARGITDENQDQIHSNIRRLFIEDNQDHDHPDSPELNQELPHHITEMLAVLKSIEDLGPRFVRGIEPIKPEVVKSCLDAYDKVKALAKKALQAREELNAR